MKDNAGKHFAAHLFCRNSTSCSPSIPKNIFESVMGF